MNTTNLSSLIWSANDDVLRGVFKPSEYTRAILPFVLLRRLDCMRINTSSLTLRSIEQSFTSYIQGFSESIQHCIAAFDIQPVLNKLKKHGRLDMFLSKFEEFELHPERVDNHQMGTVYEELLSRYVEVTNAENGEHFTPRDIVNLLVALVFAEDQESLPNTVRLFDPCCGTGGLLTAGRDWLLKNVNANMRVELYGQELNQMTWAICQADMLLTGSNPKQIGGPTSSLSEDEHSLRKFDYMISNPPFGVNWREDRKFVVSESKKPNNKFLAGLPKTSDGSMLFLQHMIDKMHSRA